MSSKAAALYGLLIAGALDLLWLGWLFPAMDPSRWGRAIAALTCLVQTVFTTGGVVFFAWLHRRLSMDAWLAVPYGALGGRCRWACRSECGRCSGCGPESL